MKVLLLFILALTPFFTFGQRSEPEMEGNLNKVAVENQARTNAQLKLATEYSKRHKIPLVYTNEFTTVMLTGVNEFGDPIFVATDNASAAVTTGVTAVRAEGGLGIKLEGYGMRIGIWDGGKVFPHIEFENRIISTDGLSFDTHATHVTGTMLAKGIDATAKGMAPKATIIANDFSNDISEMATLAKPDQSGLLLSNHSYGFVTGWDCTSGPCQWRGSAAISNQEDYRFGLYTSNARNMDIITNNAPYYTIVKSAGNDRSPTAGTGFPQDCNGGAGYDCIEETATAKNIITVGAVQKVLNYTGPADVIMSSFSGWGPTDDGRIKPDVVGNGVSVRSTVLSDGYGLLSGTSMSSPNVAGSLTLLQELYKKLNGEGFMLASTLKALTIHTAKEAGSDAGPDYKFGWGLVDVGAAANIMINKDNRNFYVSELTLSNGEVFELPLSPLANQKITATIVWNDPSGTPTAALLDPPTLMLVNDLDMRIIDDQNNIQFPWKLDPATAALGQAAFKGDNFRDNVEKIEFESPELRPYTLRINHKGSLVGGTQKFSLIVSYSSTTPIPPALYWIGGSGNWADPSHWSFTTGGTTAGGAVPNASTRVVVDENSFSTDGVISVMSSASCQTLSLLASSERVSLALNSNSIILSRDFLSADSTFSISTQGTIQLNGEGVVSVNKSDFSLGTLIFNGSSYTMKGSGKIGSILLSNGSLDLTNSKFQIQNLDAGGSSIKMLNLKNAVLSGIVSSSLNVADNLTIQSDSVIVNTNILTPSVFNWNGVDLNGTLNVQTGSHTLNGNNLIHRLAISGTVVLNGNNEFDVVALTPGATVQLGDNSVQTMSKNSSFGSSAALKTVIKATTQALINFSGSYKLCFDNLLVTNVGITGSAQINAGLNSTLANASNWLAVECKFVLVPDFIATFTCVGGQTNFLNRSQGDVETYSWDFGDAAAVSSSSITPNPTVLFSTPGNYQVRLTVSNSKFSKSISKTVTIVANNLEANVIIINGLNLFSTQSANSYQWFRNNILVPGATGRSYLFNGESGVYSVLLTGTTCNRLSIPTTITATSESVSGNQGISVFPNPSSGVVTISSSNSTVDINVRVISLTGQVMLREVLAGANREIMLSSLPNGMYLVVVQAEGKTFTQKIILNK